MLCFRQQEKHLYLINTLKVRQKEFFRNFYMKHSISGFHVDKSAVFKICIPIHRRFRVRILRTGVFWALMAAKSAWVIAGISVWCLSEVLCVT